MVWKGYRPRVCLVLAGLCFCVVFAFLAWRCTENPAVLLETAGHGDGHVLAVTVALLAILTGRSDYAGVFGAVKPGPWQSY